MTVDLSLYLVADPSVVQGRDLTAIVEQAISGGVTCVQYRDKTATDNDFMEMARRVQRVCSTHKVPFIVNDRVGIAKVLSSNGVHVGRKDMNVREARGLLGPSAIIGSSAHTLEEALRAQTEGCDYLGCGSVFVTSTKADIAGILGVGGLKRIIEGVRVPVVGIGGITEGNVSELSSVGVAGIAVISAILLSTDPAETARMLRRLVKRT